MFPLHRDSWEHLAGGCPVLRGSKTALLTAGVFGRFWKALESSERLGLAGLLALSRTSGGLSLWGLWEGSQILTCGSGSQRRVPRQKWNLLVSCGLNGPSIHLAILHRSGQYRSPARFREGP